MVAKKILEEIVPRNGLPVTVGSDKGPAFVSQIVQGLAQALGMKWKLHCEYNPQSSGQVDRMNWTLKETDKVGNRDWRGLGDPPSLCTLSGM